MFLNMANFFEEQIKCISLWILPLFALSIDGRRHQDIRRVQFLPIQPNVKVHRGETVLLPCAVINLGANKVTWRKLPFITPITTGSSLFAQDSRFEAVHKPWKNEWSLSIKNVQPHDAGVYECQISLKKNSLRQNVTLSVVDSILHREAAIKVTGDIILKQGKTLFLLCTANGMKEIPDDIQWFRDGEQVDTDYSRVNIKEHIAHNAGIITSSLEVRHTTVSDSGIYVCRATSRSEHFNILASAKVDIFEVQSKPFPSKRGTNKDQVNPLSSDQSRNSVCQQNQKRITMCIAFIFHMLFSIYI